MLSNGIETKIGTFSSGYEYFFNWLRPDSEKQVPYIARDLQFRGKKRDSHRLPRSVRTRIKGRKGLMGLKGRKRRKRRKGHRGRRGHKERDEGT